MSGSSICSNDTTFCNWCGKHIPRGSTIYSGGLCSEKCEREKEASNKSAVINGNSNPNSASDESSSVGAGVGAGLAGAGLGAGVGMAAAGVGAAVKGVGSLLGGLGKGAGAMGSLMKDGVKAEAAGNAEFRANKKKIQDLVFSSNPKEYLSQMSWLLGFAQSKSFNMADWIVADAAKARLCTEFERIKVAAPTLYAQYAGIHESLKKKKSAGMKMGILIGLLFVALVSLIPLSVISGKESKTETVRLEAIVKEIDDAIAQKDYDAALYKATKLQWTLDPAHHSNEVNTWNEQREKMTETIKELSGK